MGCKWSNIEQTQSDGYKFQTLTASWKATMGNHTFMTKIAGGLNLKKLLEEYLLRRPGHMADMNCVIFPNGWKKDVSFFPEDSTTQIELLNCFS